MLFQDVNARRQAERALQQLNQTLEMRVAEAIAERKVLADIVEGTNAYVLVADLEGRLLAVNGTAAREFQRVFGITLTVGDSLFGVLAGQPDQ